MCSFSLLIMFNLILLIFCFVLGIVFQKTNRLPKETPSVLNSFIIYISLPALVLLHIQSLEIQWELIYSVITPWIIFIVGIPLFAWIGKIRGYDRETIGCLILLGGLGNTSFVGLPMIEAYYGKEYLGIGLVVDQAGSFMALAILGIIVANHYSPANTENTSILKKILLFPPTQAILLALTLRAITYPQWLIFVLERLGSTLTPIALVSVGFQLKLGKIKEELSYLTIGLLYKLLLAPALLFLIFVYGFGASGKVIQVTLFEAAMGPMITAGIVAMEYKLRPQLATLMLGIGIPISFLTLYFWWHILNQIY